MKKYIILGLLIIFPFSSFALTYEWEIDYMEYATDGAEQAAYVSSDAAGATTVDSYSEANYDTETTQYSGQQEQYGQAIAIGSSYLITSCKFYIKKVLSPTGNAYAKIFAATGTPGTDGKPTGAALATSDAVDVSGISTSLALVTFTFSTPYALSAGDYCIMQEYSGGDSSNHLKLAYDASSPSHGGNTTRADSAGGPYDAFSQYDTPFYLYGTSANLQSYSEDTIIQQGTYSLKGVAVITDSLNDTLTHTLAEDKDLSNCTAIEYDIYALRTGSNIKIGIHDSGGTTSEHTANVASSNVNQTESWDISEVSDANKDDIDQVIITISNADAANTFYIDDLKAGLDAAAGGSYTFVQ